MIATLQRTKEFQESHFGNFERFEEIAQLKDPEGKLNVKKCNKKVIKINPLIFFVVETNFAIIQTKMYKKLHSKHSLIQLAVAYFIMYNDIWSHFCYPQIKQLFKMVIEDFARTKKICPNPFFFFKVLFLKRS